MYSWQPRCVDLMTLDAEYKILDYVYLIYRYKSLVHLMISCGSVIKSSNSVLVSRDVFKIDFHFHYFFKATEEGIGEAET